MDVFAGEYAVDKIKKKKGTSKENHLIMVRRRLVTIGKIIVGAICVTFFLFPIYWLLLVSISNNELLLSGVNLIPKKLVIENYILLFVEKGFDVALKNSIKNATLALFGSLAVGVCAAYILSMKRFELKMRRPFTIWVLLVRVVPPVAFVVPLYTMFNKVGVLGSRLPIVLSCMLINIPLIIWFLISFFRGIPKSIMESGKIDGASEWQIFSRLMLPLTLPGIAAVSMLSFMYAWNEYTYSIILTRSADNYTIPLALAVLNTEDNVTNYGLVAAGGVISFIPVLLFVIFAQNYLINGLSGGSVKE